MSDGSPPSPRVPSRAPPTGRGGATRASAGYAKKMMKKAMKAIRTKKSFRARPLLDAM